VTIYVVNWNYIPCINTSEINVEKLRYWESQGSHLQCRLW